MKAKLIKAFLFPAIAVALMIGTLLVIRAIVSRRHAGIFQEMAQASQQLLHR